MSNLSQTTTDHEQIRKWAEARGGKPAHVKGTGGGDDTGIIRIDFPGYSGAGKLEEISWGTNFSKNSMNRGSRWCIRKRRLKVKRAISISW